MDIKRVERSYSNVRRCKNRRDLKKEVFILYLIFILIKVIKILIIKKV